MSNDNNNNRRITPGSVRNDNARGNGNLNYVGSEENDLDVFLINPQNGRSKIGRDLADIYNIKVQTNRGKEKTVQDVSVWDLYTAVTPDTRLSNLTKDQEKYVQWALKMEGLCLMANLKKSSAMASWLRMSICEPSLGRGMALRQNLQTIHSKSESINIEDKPEKRSLFGFLKK